MIKIIIFVIMFATVVIGGLYFLINSARKLHKEIDSIERDAKSATTKLELESTWKRLRIVSRKSWHRTLESRIIEVKTFIHTKYQYCK